MSEFDPTVSPEDLPAWEEYTKQWAEYDALEQPALAEPDPAYDNTLSAVYDHKRSRDPYETPEELQSEAPPERPGASTLTENQLKKRPEFQAAAKRWYDYRRELDPSIPRWEDPEMIAHWMVNQLSWLNNNMTGFAIDYNKIRKAPIGTMSALIDAWDAYDATDTTLAQGVRGTLFAATDMINFFGLSSLMRSAGAGLGKQALKAEVRGIVQQARRAAARVLQAATKTGTRVGAIEGASAMGAYEAGKEDIRSTARGEEYDTAGVLGMTAAGGLFGAALGGLPHAAGWVYHNLPEVSSAIKSYSGDVMNNWRVMRASTTGPIRTQHGGKPTWTVSQDDAVKYAGDPNSEVFVADLQPQDPVILDKDSYTMEEVVRDFNLQPAEVKLLDALGDEFTGQDLANHEGFLSLMESRGTDAVAFKEGEEVNVKVLNRSALRTPAGVKPGGYIPRSQRGMVGTWYHGSGAKHDGFDEAFLRSGEGAAVYGEGFYVAQNKSTGKWYQEKLGGGVDAKLRGESVSGLSNPYLRDAVNDIAGWSSPGTGKAPMPFAEAKAEALHSLDMHRSELLDGWRGYEHLEDYETVGKPAIKQVEAAIEQVRGLGDGDVQASSGGHLYRTDVVPDESEFLKWDEPLSGQSDEVQAALAKLGIDAVDNQNDPVSPSLAGLVDAYSEILEGRAAGHPQEARLLDISDEIYNDLLDQNSLPGAPLTYRRLKEMIEEVEGILGSDSPGSEKLRRAIELREDIRGSEAYQMLLQKHGRANIRDVMHKAGIKGNMYLDGMSRHKGEGTYNLVVFKAEDIKVRQRDGDYFPGYNAPAAMDWLKGKGHDLEELGYRDHQDYVDFAKAQGWADEVGGPPPGSSLGKQGGHVGSVKKAAPVAQGPLNADGWKIEKNRVSQRLPTGVKPIGDPNAEMLKVDLAAVEAGGRTKQLADLIRQYPQFTGDKGMGDREVLDTYIDHEKENLKWLFNLVPDAIRQATKQWYVGANKVSVMLGKRYGLSDRQSSAIVAVLSPGTKWDANVTMAERVMETMANMQAVKSTAKMDEVANRIWTTPSAAAAWKAIAGKRLQDLETIHQKAMWIRTYDQAHRDRAMRAVNPAGYFGDIIRNKQTAGQKKRGELAAPSGWMWQSTDNIAKAVEIFENDSMELISNRLGDAHKVRNFYNNIVDPSDRHSVTMDTHAVAALNIMPFSQNAEAVKHNFGSNLKGSNLPGPGKNKNTGEGGTYAINAEAYRRAAAELSEELGYEILPRELQSITWEAVRGLFTDKFKAKKSNVDKVSRIWDNYRAGKIGVDDAREQILTLAGGIDEPYWLAAGSGENAGNQWDSSYAGDLAAGRVRRGQSGRAGGAVAGVGGRDPGVPDHEGLSPYPILGATAAVGAAGIPLVPYIEGAYGNDD